MAQCPVCGKKIIKGIPHCPHCGANLYSKDEKHSVGKKIQFKKVYLQNKQFRIIGIILIVCLITLGYKAITHRYSDETNVIEEAMVENYSFRSKISDMDNNAHDIDELIKLNFETTSSTFKDEVTSDLEDVSYKGTYNLSDGGILTTAYLGNSEMKTCSLEIDYSTKLASFSDYEALISQLEGTYTTIGTYVLSEPFTAEAFHEGFMNFYSKYMNGASGDELGFVSVNKCYSYVTFEQGEDGVNVNITFTYDPCKVIFK